MTGEIAADRGLLLGEACFETMRVVQGEIFAWQAHHDRLCRGLAAFGLDCPDGLLPRCLAAAGETGDDALLRLTVSGGEAPRGLMVPAERLPQVHIQAWPYQAASQELALRTLHWPLSGMARIAKFTADYAFTIRLLHQARHAGQLSEDEQALFTLGDELLCMETANILISIDGEWRTPDSDAVLPGVVREVLLTSGSVTACACPLEWLLACDAMAICNSGCFIRPVASVNGRRLDTHAGHFAPLLDALRGQPGVPGNLACA